MSKIQDKINELTGSCDSFDYDGWSDGDIKLLEEQIFLCETCGWWCEKDELADDSYDQVCDDCYIEEDE